MERKVLKSVRRVVVKLGSSVLTAQAGSVDRKCLENIVGDLIELMKRRYEIILVSSGAIALGMNVQGLKRRPKELPKLQACAAIGQGKLMALYESLFAAHGVHTGQVLLTHDGLHERKRFLNAQNTFHSLHRMGILPIVNENDTVATEEIRFGDNDMLAVFVASLVKAELVMVLSDVDGFFRKDKARIPLMSSLEQINEGMRQHVFAGDRATTVGGMHAKLKAAKIAMQQGLHQVIVDGKSRHVIRSVLKGEDVGTFFLGVGKRWSAKKTWLAFSARPKGKIVVDAGACQALVKKGSSLLARGIQDATGEFQVGEPVELVNPDGIVFAQGLSNYAKAEVTEIQGKKTSDIERVLGYKYYDEVIHRDNLVILKER